MLATPPTLAVTSKELAELCAIDSNLYCQTFFPTTFRQPTPPFHQDMWNLLEDRQHRYVALEVFRGGAKTTTLRTYVSKRIAYGVSRTILFVSESQAGSEKSLRWIKRQIEKNKIWTDVFGLIRGSKWTDELIEIQNIPLDITTTVIAVGITGQIRGINVEDFRPDLIVVDDPCDEENSATPEQRQKISNLFFGALEKSLTPASECPDAKQALLQTSLNREDLINNCHIDPQWASRKYSCFDDAGESRWPERLPTDGLVAAKEAHIRRGQISLWMREMECTVVAEETCSFKETWLRYYEDRDLPRGMTCFIGIDPLPPPSDKEISVGFRRKDHEVIAVIGVQGPDKYILDISRRQGHTPEWTVAEFFRLADKWRPIKARVECTGYQRTLKWLLEKAMAERRRWVQIDASNDRRKKSHRITQAYSGIGSEGHLFIRKEFTSFIDQFVTYPNCVHDDDLDAVSMALDASSNLLVNVEEYELTHTEPELVGNWRSAP